MAIIAKTCFDPFEFPIPGPTYRVTNNSGIASLTRLKFPGYENLRSDDRIQIIRL
jgi:hypothetical protein